LLFAKQLIVDFLPPPQLFGLSISLAATTPAITVAVAVTTAAAVPRQPTAEAHFEYGRPLSSTTVHLNPLLAFAMTMEGAAK
jgi:hypothetical protein